MGQPTERYCEQCLEDWDIDALSKQWGKILCPKCLARANARTSKTLDFSKFHQGKGGSSMKYLKNLNPIFSWPLGVMASWVIVYALYFGF